MLISEGEVPIWVRSGELFYVSDGRLWAAKVDTEQILDWTDPKALFQTPWQFSTNGVANFDVTADGERFVFVEDLVEDAPRRQINVVLNWVDELQRLVPVP